MPEPIEPNPHSNPVVAHGTDGQWSHVRQPDGGEAWVRSDAQTHSDARVIPVVEEQLVLDRHVEETVVRVHQRVTEREEHVRVDAVKETVDVERVPVGRFVDGPIDVRHEGDTMVVPVIEEVLVVEKRLRLVEEVRITRRKSATPYEGTAVLRRQEVEVERERLEKKES